MAIFTDHFAKLLETRDKQIPFEHYQSFPEDPLLLELSRAFNMPPRTRRQRLALAVKSRLCWPLGRLFYKMSVKLGYWHEEWYDY